jgi:hypothetical protein
MEYINNYTLLTLNMSNDFFVTNYTPWEKVFVITPKNTKHGKTGWFTNVMRREDLHRLTGMEHYYEYQTIDDYELEQLMT